MEKIIRLFDVELRAMGEETQRVSGQAVVFNQETDLGWFIERIDSHAFDEADMSDVVLNYNHNDDILLAGTRNGSLQLQVRDTGLFQDADVIDTTQGRDIMKLVRKGLINKMSFAFTIAKGGETWEKRGDKEVRTIMKIDRLYDVSLVTFPAYSQTSVYARGVDKLAEEHKKLMERREAQDKQMEEIFNERNLRK